MARVIQMADPKSSKQELRAEALARRDSLGIQYRIEASLRLAETAGDLAPDPGAAVSGFMPIRSEMDLRPLMAALRSAGARLCLPAIIDRETIVFRELVRGAALVDMGFGTVGPGPEADVLEPGLMLVPLAAFDERGHRIGYGGGYYDRAIARLTDNGPGPRLVGVAFDCQKIDHVPDEPHDQRLAEILTESGLHRTEAGYR